jgi:hypothetical protein
MNLISLIIKLIKLNNRFYKTSLTIKI